MCAFYFHECIKKINLTTHRGGYCRHSEFEMTKTGAHKRAHENKVLAYRGEIMGLAVEIISFLCCVLEYYVNTFLCFFLNNLQMIVSLIYV